MILSNKLYSQLWVLSKLFHWWPFYIYFRIRIYNLNLIRVDIKSIECCLHYQNVVYWIKPLINGPISFYFIFPFFTLLQLFRFKFNQSDTHSLSKQNFLVTQAGKVTINLIAYSCKTGLVPGCSEVQYQVLQIWELGNKCPLFQFLFIVDVCGSYGFSFTRICFLSNYDLQTRNTSIAFMHTTFYTF